MGNARCRARGRVVIGARSVLLGAFYVLLVLNLTPVNLKAQTDDPPVRGPFDAPLEVIEFSDFECPFCGRAQPVVDSLLSAFGDRVRFEYRHYPLPSHPHAAHASEASIEAHRQRAFWPYHDLLFSNQDRLTDEDLVAFAKLLDLDSQRFSEILETGEHAPRVQADLTLGFSLAVSGTPTFFINGYRLVGVPPMWVFERALQATEKGLIERLPLMPVEQSGR